MENSKRIAMVSRDQTTDEVVDNENENNNRPAEVNASARSAAASTLASPTVANAAAVDNAPAAVVDSVNEKKLKDDGESESMMAKKSGENSSDPRHRNLAQRQQLQLHHFHHHNQQQQQPYHHQPTEENTTEDDYDDYFYDERGLIQQRQQNPQYPQEHDSQYGEYDDAKYYDNDKQLLSEGKNIQNFEDNAGNHNNNHVQEEEEEEITPTSSSYCSSTTSPSSSLRQQQHHHHHQPNHQGKETEKVIHSSLPAGSNNLESGTNEQSYCKIDDHGGIMEEGVRKRKNETEEEKEVCRALSDLQLLESAVRQDALVLSNHNALHNLGCLDVLDNDKDGDTVTGENETMALAVLPPHELSTTSAEAAMAASTFADMLGGGGVMGGGHGDAGFSGEGVGIGEERGIWIDEHGVHHPMMGMGAGGSVGGLDGAGDGGVGITSMGTGMMAEEIGEDPLLGRGMGGSGNYTTGIYGRVRREGPPGLVVDDSGVVRKASSIRVSPMSSSRGGGVGGGGIGGNSGVGMMAGPGGGINSGISGWQGLYQGLHSLHHDSTHVGGGNGGAGRGILAGGDDTTMGNCGGMGVCGGVDPLSSPRMDPIEVDVDDTASELEGDEEDVEEDEEDDEEEDSSEISASDEDGSWIEWFCGLRGNEFFCEVDEDYIQDDFNLTGLNSLVPCYERALDMVLDVEMPNEDSLTEEQHEIVESAAEILYGMIHARYIVTSRGMNAMYEKYRSATFGRCPHVYCQGQPVLPVGLSDMPRNFTVNVFCPRCHGLFFPKSTRQANIDGAYFGTTFPHLYLMTHPEMIPVRPSQQYVPRVYGFRINQSSLYYRYHEGEEEDNRALTRSSRSRQR